MCLLIYFPKGTQPDVEALRNGADNNPHGHGWGIWTPDRILTGRYMSADDAIKSFVKERKLNPEGPALFHSRIATAGVLTEYNVHPFPVAGDKRTFVAHNGILPHKAQPLPKDKRSDTHLFAAEYLAQGRFGNLYSRRGRKHLAQWLGRGNKLVVLSLDPRLPRGVIFNESAGSWHRGIWYSNDSWQDDYGMFRWSSSYGSYRPRRRYYATNADGTVIFRGGSDSDGRWQDYVDTSGGSGGFGAGYGYNRCRSCNSEHSTILVDNVELCVTCRACQDCDRAVLMGEAQNHKCAAFGRAYSVVHGECPHCSAKERLMSVSGITYCSDCRTCQGCGDNVPVGRAPLHSTKCPRLFAENAMGYEPNRMCNLCHETGCIAATMICSKCRACQDCGMHETSCLCWNPHDARETVR